MHGLTSWMRVRLRSGGFLIAGGGLLLLFLLVLSFGLNISFNDPGPAGATPMGECTTQVHFFASDVGTSHFFGPPVTQTSVDDQLVELHNRRCQDPALVVAHAYGEKIPGFAQLNGDEQFAAKIRELLDNRQLWLDTIKALEAHEAQAVNVANGTMSGNYQTLYMVTRPMDVPLIRAASPDKPAFTVLRWTWSDGTTFSVKLNCGFQNVAQEFPGVPPLNAPLPPPPTTPTTSCVNCITTTTGPCVNCITTTTAKPPTSWECQQNGTGPNCPAGVQRVRQDPQNNTTSGVNVGPTPGAPTAEPPPSNRSSGDPNGGSGDGGAGPGSGPVDGSHGDDSTDSGNQPPNPWS